MLLPATVQEFVDKDHLARLVLSLVVEAIDLEAIERVYRVDRGQPPFDPAMMTALLLSRAWPASAGWGLAGPPGRSWRAARLDRNHGGGGTRYADRGKA
jgi:hypothetical protein